jgi:hypothetical protein
LISIASATSKSAEPNQLKIGVFDSSRSAYPGNYSIATGAPFTTFRSLLLNSANFGPDGITARSVVFNSLSAITPHSLETMDVLALYQWQDLQSTETQLVETFVKHGGSLLIFSTTMPSILNTTWTLLGSSRYGQITQPGTTSPLIKGPYGNVSTIYLGYNGSAADVGQGFAVSLNSAGPNILTFSSDHGFSGLGRAVLISDEEIFMNGAVANRYVGQMDASSENSKLLLNTIAFLAGAPGYQGVSVDPVQVMYPAGGETLAGNTYTSISWQSDVVYSGTAVRFELWQGDHRLQDLGRDSSSEGHKTSIVYLPLVPVANDYHFRVISTYNSAIWADSLPFSITGGAIHLNTPNGGEHWNSNSLQQIAWSMGTATAGTGAKIELWNATRKVADLGFGWNPLGSGMSWITVPPVLSGSDYRIRLISTWEPDLWDESDATFSILGLSKSAVRREGWACYE